ncbi:MAG TPA: hypothetical protein VIL20_21485 [Sandaracinaceae bacterium]
MREDAGRKARRLDAWLYGTAGVLALVGLAVGLADRSAGAPVAPPPSEERAPEDDRERIVPALPPVPDLATQPPPARPGGGEDDPRLAQLGAEMRFLGRARELLGERPGEALAILEQHRRAHPHGILREEREAFAIEALVALDRRTEAERRYYDFLRAYPSSELAPRLRFLMR